MAGLITKETNFSLPCNSSIVKNEPVFTSFLLLIVPEGNSTLMSTDSDGMSFDIFTSDFEVGRSYEADVMIKHGESDQIFKSVGGIFRIDP